VTLPFQCRAEIGRAIGGIWLDCTPESAGGQFIAKIELGRGQCEKQRGNPGAEGSGACRPTTSRPGSAMTVNERCGAGPRAPAQRAASPFRVYLQSAEPSTRNHQRASGAGLVRASGAMRPPHARPPAIGGALNPQSPTSDAERGLVPQRSDAASPFRVYLQSAEPSTRNHQRATLVLAYSRRTRVHRPATG